MIGYLEGKILNIDKISEKVIIMTQSGVGYLVNYYKENLNIGDDISLFIHSNMSESSISLWGFQNKSELVLFNLLLSVSGVGPTSAANMLNKIGIAKLVTSIRQGKPEGIKAPGVGTKTAQKVLIDLKGKIDKYPELLKLAEHSSSPEISSGLDSHIEDAILALVSLGYNKSLVENFFRTENPTGDTTQLIKIYLANHKK